MIIPNWHIVQDVRAIQHIVLLATAGLFILLLTGNFCTAAVTQPPQLAGTLWTKSYPDSDFFEAQAITRTADGGYLVTGTGSSDKNRHALLLFKTDSAGNEQWRTTGSGNSCVGNAVIAGKNGNATVLGGGCDTGTGVVTLTFINNAKGTVWQNWNYEAGGHATGTALISTGDGGYLFLAEGDSRVAGRNDRDVMIYRIDSKGAVLWTKSFSGPLNDTAKAVVMTPDGGFVVVGSSINSESRRQEILIIKLNGQGIEQWVRTTRTQNDDTAISIALAGDGGYVIAGTSCRPGRSGDCDIHVIRIDEAGTTLWDRKYGGSGRESAALVLTSPEGGYTILGSSDSKERGALDRDVHIVHIDDQGNELWTNTFGTPSYEFVTGGVTVADGSLVITGYATDPVETKRRTLFITSIGLAGRNPPPELLRLASTARKNSGVEVRVRDEKSGAGISGAQVYYDGKLMGWTSETEGMYLIEKPGTGSHSVRVVKPGYTETTVMADGTTGSSLTVQLQPSAIRQIYGDASPKTALDIIFVPSNTSYDCGLHEKIVADQYMNNPEIFLQDVRQLSELRLFQLGRYSSVPAKISADYKKHLNIYYFWDGERYADAFNGCAGTPPYGIWDEAPFADVVIILYPRYYGLNKQSGCEPTGCTNGIGPGTGSWFKAPANNGQVFLHESGHAIFGLMDTYCGDTYYAENMPFPNIWQSVKNCTYDTQKHSGEGAGCRPISGGVSGSRSTCDKDYLKFDRDPDLMASTSSLATFGESATQRIQYILDAAGRN
ncbi:MAG: hypothetical protein Q8S57_09560 [Methanoregula sp.]|nr:hypothetical protein [Methanoregula sp.]